MPTDSYLEWHGGSYRVSVNVPIRIRDEIGAPKLRKDLGTDSLRVANMLKERYVSEFKGRIQAALDAKGLGRKKQMIEAMELAALLAELRERKAPKAEIDEVEQEILQRSHEMRWEAAPWVVQREIPSEEFPDGQAHFQVPTEEQSDRARQWAAVALGDATPIDWWHRDYLAGTDVQIRTKADDVRSLRLLLEWLQSKGVPGYVERVTAQRARLFADDLPGMTGLAPATNNKYLSRLSSYWNWMVPRVHGLQHNPWLGVTVAKRKTKADEEERPFTDAEVARLLMGPATPHMRDLMMLGALTGARLDAIVDLKVRDTDDGLITFKPQKKETSERTIPAHPLLEDVIARRCEGKGPDDDLFPEWPPVRKVGSMRERSFKASNHFTDYRREAGVDHVLPGKRRSLVNFHSFRRWFISRLEQADVPGDLIAAIVGHKRSGLTLGRYSSGPLLRQAAEAIARVKLPPLDGSPIVEPRGLRARPKPGGDA
ncbi:MULTISPECIES: tyrosine-type recombinase/integrase [unclassified Methylobacterium]|jgi:integrase|uniref:tyrosine-type recombinase/integrase n=1 Tax=unclassified Methylobacterium TaxID=2615210 RepID=UPI0013533ACE|nr:tyrosine-type recombinase/integrase [Methylobacterium sp. 2A]MWV22479.1 tyrosine-type recombinase/integrase [Methylobacterium sp. 2A]